MEYFITFIEGVASFVSPCVLPVIPIYISYFATGSKSSKKTLLNALGFVCGFSIIFILLGVFAGTFGKFIHEYVDYFNIIFGVFLIFIGLNYMGFLIIKIFNIYYFFCFWSYIFAYLDSLCWSFFIICFNTCKYYGEYFKRSYITFFIFFRTCYSIYYYCFVFRKT